jgi:hypothetical protein
MAQEDLVAALETSVAMAAMQVLLGLVAQAVLSHCWHVPELTWKVS